ncbi:pectate lyase [Rheinheimera texasensis]|uniref:pectate lyase n=1 Tax=Rheinheimera texasensis TaxID=306205 RepID=UPI0032B1E157
MKQGVLALLFASLLSVGIAGGPAAAAGTPDLWYHPKPLSADWQAFHAQSARDLALLEQQLNSELAGAKLSAPLPAVKAKNFGLDAISNSAQLQAVLSYQTVLGGWSKRTDMQQVRKPGQLAGSEPAYIPTFDNGATSSQMRWLAAYYPKATAADQAKIRSALTLAVQFVLRAQYPNGGFAQSYPLRGSYHDAVTLNDNVMTDLLNLLWDIANAPEYQWLNADLRSKAQTGFAKGVAWLVAAQVSVNGQGTVWTAQHHPLSGEPVAARKFEQISLVSSESAAVLQLLLDKAPEQPGVLPALCSGVAWLAQHQIRDKVWQRDDAGSKLVEKKGAQIWARFYSLPQQQPVFFDRDGKVYHDVNQLSLERQQGYGWYQSNAKNVLKAWKKKPELAAQCASPVTL